MVSHSKLKTFTFPSTRPNPFILRIAEGEAAESILQQTTLPAQRQAGEAAM